MNMLETFALSALADFPEACDALRPVRGWQVMFTFPDGLAIADWAMGNEGHCMNMLEPDECARVAAVLDDMEWMRPTDVAWAVHCVNEFVKSRAWKNLPESLRWAATQIETGRLDVRSALREAMVLA